MWKMLYSILSADIENGFAELEKDDTNQCRRRAVFHFIFAWLEGLIFMMKQVTLDFHKAGYGKLSEAEIAMLKEESYEIDRKGNAVSQRKFLRFEDNFKFSFKAFSSVLDADFKLNLGNDSRWDSLLKSISKRNKITHPKKFEDLTLSDEDLGHVKEAFAWLTEKIQYLSNACDIRRAKSMVKNKFNG